MSTIEWIHHKHSSRDLRRSKAHKLEPDQYSNHSLLVGRKGIEDHKKTLRGRVKIELDVQ